MSAKKVNQFLAVVALLIVLYYSAYRALYTFPADASWFAIIFYLAELHGAFVFFLFCLETWDPQHPSPEPAPEGLNVDIYICTYNEEPELLRKTILGAEAITYPHKTYVCDDGRREEVKTLAEELGVEYITRPDNEHAKAGNINHALQHTQGDFIAILDADHVPLICPPRTDPGSMLGFDTVPGSEMEVIQCQRNVTRQSRSSASYGRQRLSWLRASLLRRSFAACRLHISR